MAFSRRGFVQTVGIGSAALTGAWIGARGREDAIWSAFEPTLEAVEPGVICLASNENPLGPGKTVMKAVRDAFGEGGRAPGRYSGSSRRPHRRDREEAGRQAREHRPRMRLDADPPHVHAPLHGEGQGARRHHPDLRGMRRLRRDDGHPVRAVALDADFKIDLGKMADAAKGAGLVFYCNPEQSDRDLRRRQGHARLPRQGQPRVARDDDPRRRGVLRLRHRSRSRHAHRARRREPARRRRAHVLEGLRHGRPAYGLRRRPRGHDQEDARTGTAARAPAR